ncbi:MAG: periplasmic heavy metal sensor [Verrucomicrobiales bacterium]|jgi:Spy/CpxP family protein refolding chaperone|nr:periplasmic heavy metal sensor [Verrucomicrobiales bacterium]
MTNSKFRLTLVLIGMFVFGAVSGIALNTFWRPYFPSPPHQGDIQRHILEFLTQRLGLSEQQQEQIRPIIADFSRQVEEFHRQSVSQLDELSRQTDEKISQFLTPEQKLELQRMASERAQGFKRHGPDMRGLPPPQHGPPPLPKG